MAKKSNMQFQMSLSEDLLRRLYYIAKAEGRSPNNHLLHLLRQNMQYFERVHGRISEEALRQIDLNLPENTEIK